MQVEQQVSLRLRFWDKTVETTKQWKKRAGLTQ
jgi:hypothetical protein